MSIIKSSLIVVLFLAAQASFARPSTKEECEASFNKIIAAVNGMSDEEFAKAVSPTVVESLSNSKRSPSERLLLLDAHVKQLRESYALSLNANKALCFLGRGYPEFMNKRLNVFSNLGVLTNEDFLDERKSEL